MKPVISQLSDEKKGVILAQQFQAAEDGRKNIIVFGLMLEELENSIILPAEKNSVGRPNKLGNWLETYAPDVNYKTAMGYRKFAVNARNLWLAETRQTTAELAAPDTYAQEVFDFVKNIPLNDLKGKPGRKSLAAGGTAPEPRKRLTADDRIAMAEADLIAILSGITDFLKSGKEKLVMDHSIRSHARKVLDDLADALK